MSATVEQLAAQVFAVNTRVIEKAMALIKAFSAQLEAAGTDQAKLDALSAGIESTDTAMTAVLIAATSGTPLPGPSEAA